MCVCVCVFPAPRGGGGGGGCWVYAIKIPGHPCRNCYIMYVDYSYIRGGSRLSPQFCGAFLGIFPVEKIPRDSSGSGIITWSCDIFLQISLSRSNWSRSIFRSPDPVPFQYLNPDPVRTRPVKFKEIPWFRFPCPVPCKPVKCAIYIPNPVET